VIIRIFKKIDFWFHSFIFELFEIVI